MLHQAIVLGAARGAVRWLTEPDFGPSVRRRPAPAAPTASV
ncbi:glycosyltransferase family 2 protein [Streptomyces tanashiensis]